MRPFNAPGEAAGVTILLGGGGSPDDERSVLDRFNELVGDRPIAYLPVALGLDDYTAATRWVTDALQRSVDAWSNLSGHSPIELAAVGGVFIGGGNTFHLLNEIRAAGLVGALSTMTAGSVIYGGSAGAIVLGSDIGTAGFFDPNDVGLDDTTGIGLLGAFAVWPHFVEEHNGPIEEWVTRSRRPVLALSERAGAEIEDTTLTALGPDPVIVVDQQCVRAQVPPEATFSLTHS